MIELLAFGWPKTSSDWPDNGQSANALSPTEMSCQRLKSNDESEWQDSKALLPIVNEAEGMSLSVTD